MSSLMRRLIYKLLITIFDNPLPPPSAQEIAMIDELKETFRGFQHFDTRDVSPLQAVWNENMNRLCELVLRDDPREFLRWDVVRKTIFVSHSDFVRNELRYLSNQSGWRARWRKAIRECTTGHPLPYPLYPKSSGNLIHHTYHLAQFEEKIGIRIDNFTFVFEFGGGYGSMCRLFHNLGFRGKYVIFDLPAFSTLQRFYLRTLNIPVLSASSFHKESGGVICISDIDELKTLLSFEPMGANESIFVSTWSLSETPINLRMAILPLIADSKTSLIAYQDEFGGVNNVKFFSNWKESLDKRVKWYNWEITHIPRSFYLFGKRLEI